MAGLLLIVTVAACSSDQPAAHAPSSRPASTAPSAATTPAASERCGPPNLPAQARTLQTLDGVTLAAVELGAGPRGVVLIHELGGQALCGWWAYGNYLSRQGFHVLLFDQRCAGYSACPTGSAGNRLIADVAAAVAEMKHLGARKVVLVGASRGGSLALAAAPSIGAPVTAVADLSGDEVDEDVAGGPAPVTARSTAPRVRVRVLYALEESDRYIRVADARAVLNRIPGSGKTLIVLPAGSGHGWDLVYGAQLSSVSTFSATLVTFLRAHT